MTETLTRVLSLKSGETFDEFTIEQLLGKGLSGTALAYKVQKDAVVKLYTAPISNPSDKLRYEKFKNEATLLKTMSKSPYVLNSKSGFREHAIHEKVKRLAPYYAMEVMDGSLEDLVYMPDLTLEQKLDIAIQILQGMADCHKEKICHRDIYTPNILYRMENKTIVCKIADFGSAKLHGKKQIEVYFHPTGNIRYTSPEAAVGLIGGDKPEFNVMTAADIFALGLLLYEVITGLKQEKLNASMQGAVHRSYGDGIWDKATTHDQRKEYLKKTILPSLTTVKINPITASDILEGEKVADELNGIFMSMIAFDYDNRQSNIGEVINGLESVKKKVNGNAAKSA